jgi:hypothetical protein
LVEPAFVVPRAAPLAQPERFLSWKLAEERLAFFPLLGSKKVFFAAAHVFLEAPTTGTDTTRVVGKLLQTCVRFPQAVRQHHVEVVGIDVLHPLHHAARRGLGERDARAGPRWLRLAFFF